MDFIGNQLAESFIKRNHKKLWEEYVRLYNIWDRRCGMPTYDYVSCVSHIRYNNDVDGMVSEAYGNLKCFIKKRIEPVLEKSKAYKFKVWCEVFDSFSHDKDKETEQLFKCFEVSDVKMYSLEYKNYDWRSIPQKVMVNDNG